MSNTGLAAGDRDLAGDHRPGVLELVRGHEDGAALGRRGPHHGVEHLTALGVEPGMRFVEEQEPRVA